MKKADYRYIYGPVPSWRLGSSLGIDPLSAGRKVCSFDCLYCQIGKTEVLTDKRQTFVKTKDILEEIKGLPSLNIDYMTFSGTGEPTLAENLGEMISAVREARGEKIAVLTNSSLMHRRDVQKDLSAADLVVAKLDASREEVFDIINRPAKGVTLKTVIKGIKDFKKHYQGKLALQIMFMEPNKECAKGIARIAEDIMPDEVQLNTPLRPCGVRPLSKSEMEAIERHFKGLNTVSVYGAAKKDVTPISSKDTLKRRGKI